MKNTIVNLIFCLLLSLSYLSLAEAQGEEPWEGAYTSEPFAGGAIREVYCDLTELVEGNFGGLLFTVAGVVAFAMSVFGEGRQAKNIFVVAVGAATISALISLYFGDLGCATRSWRDGAGTAAGGGAGTTGGTGTAATRTKTIEFPSLYDSSEESTGEESTESASRSTEAGYDDSDMELF